MKRAWVHSEVVGGWVESSVPWGHGEPVVIQHASDAAEVVRLLREFAGTKSLGCSDGCQCAACAAHALLGFMSTTE
jgi:hypothetical protein